MENMMIQGTEISVKEYKGKRVVTFKDIDTVHQRPDGTASRNFRTNRQRFISGVDFFKICADEIRRNKIMEISAKAHEDVTLITESGYLMLVKSFTDDLAWKVQRELVDSYFRVRAEPDEEVISNIVESGIPTLVVSTDNLIRCAEIMAGCLDGNRPYVLNILRPIVPDIDTVSTPTETTVMEAPVLENPTQATVIGGRCYRKPFNHIQFSNYLIEHKIKHYWLEAELGCSAGCVGAWARGTKPSEMYRIKLCQVLNLPIGYFDNSKRVRRIQRYE